MEYYQKEFANGIRVVFKPINNQVVHTGLLLNTGSRDEQLNEMGIAHFIEHTIFKGTKKRKTYQILNRLENIGGELNAFTSKEETCIYASILTPYFERAIELIFDISQNSIFPENEIQKEKDVVIDEINSYKDNPSEAIYDEIEDFVFENHPLGRNILGTKKSVKSIKRKTIIDFIEKNYTTDEMVICVLGNLKVEQVFHSIEKYFGQISSSKRRESRLDFEGYIPKHLQFKKGIHQAHCVLANEAYGRNHKDRGALILLNNILGGPVLNSRLNMGIREKYGFCYNIESNYTQFTETGLFTIYMGTEMAYMDKTVDLVYKELKKLREKKLGSLQLHYSKQQIIGQLAIAQESNVNEMIAVGKSILAYNKVDNTEEMYSKFKSISSESLIEVANEIFQTDRISSLIYTAK